MLRYGRRLLRLCKRAPNNTSRPAFTFARLAMSPGMAAPRRHVSRPIIPVCGTFSGNGLYLYEDGGV
jgi:hypothetical protein